MNTDLPTDNPKKETDDENNASPQLNSPELDEKTGKPTKRAISSFKQAHSIAKTLKNRAVDTRIKTAGTIARKYGGEEPFKQSDLTRANQDWRNNYSTHFLASILDRTVPQLLDPIKKVDTVTFSSLPEEYEKAADKSRIFREKITGCIRSWRAWNENLAALAQDNVLYGLAIPARLDDSDWRFTLFGFGESYLPEGTGQHASKVQIAVFSQRMLIHKFLELFENQSAAKDEGYDIEGCIKTANEKTGSIPGGGEPTQLDIADAIRETGITAYSFENQTKTIDLYHVLVREYDGKVDLWTTSQQSGHAIRYRKGLFDRMEEAMTLFTFQTGNKKLYGSKGLGRYLVNLHVAIERQRCLAADQMILSGMIILSCDAKTCNQLQANLKFPFMLVPEGAKVQQVQFEFNATSYEIMDQKLTNVAESIAGAFVPPDLDQSNTPNTKIEAAQKAERQLAVREGVRGRFYIQFSDLVSMMQRGICAPQNLKEAWRIFQVKQAKEKQGIKVLGKRVYDWLKEAIGGAITEYADSVGETKIADTEAVQCLIEMLDAGLSPEEIVVLASTPADNNTDSSMQDKDLATATYIANNRGNPFLDQKEATKIDAQIQLGKDRAQQLILPDKPDQNIAAVATRDQRIEFSEMMDGTDMPVASTDNHTLHRQELVRLATPVMQSLEQSPTAKLTNTGQLLMNHWQQHLQQDTQTDEPTKKNEMQAAQPWINIVTQAQKYVQKFQQQTGKNPEDMPAQVQGQPMQAGTDGSIVGEGGSPFTPDHALKAEQQQTDAQLRAASIALQARDQNLQEQKHLHQVQMDHAKLSQDAGQAQLDAVRAGAEDAQKQQDAIIAAETQKGQDQ